MAARKTTAVLPRRIRRDADHDRQTLPARAGDPSRGRWRSPTPTPTSARRRGSSGARVSSATATSPRRRACPPSSTRRRLQLVPHRDREGATRGCRCRRTTSRPTATNPSTTRIAPEAATAQPIRGATLRRSGARSTPPMTQSSDDQREQPGQHVDHVGDVEGVRARSSATRCSSSVTSRPGGRWRRPRGPAAGATRTARRRRRPAAGSAVRSR